MNTDASERISRMVYAICRQQVVDRTSPDPIAFAVSIQVSSVVFEHLYGEILSAGHMCDQMSDAICGRMAEMGGNL
jgi:hypothetical protein